MEEVLKKTRRTSQRQDCDLGHEGVELDFGMCKVDMGGENRDC
jgi:hypothetical protein